MKPIYMRSNSKLGSQLLALWHRIKYAGLDSKTIRSGTKVDVRQSPVARIPELLAIIFRLTFTAAVACLFAPLFVMMRLAIGLHKLDSRRSTVAIIDQATERTIVKRSDRPTRSLSAEQKEWIAEMESFDRF